jgi:hypothetical protein
MAYGAAATDQHSAFQPPMTIPTLIMVYVTAMLAALGGVGIYTDMRNRRFHPRPNEDRIFRCTVCGYVYTDDPDVDRSRCAHCGKLNEPIQF